MASQPLPAEKRSVYKSVSFVTRMPGSPVSARSAPGITVTKQCGAWLGVAGRPAGRVRSTGVAYIKVHESEIADDYPEPAPYAAEEEEADELVLFGEEEDYGAAAPDPDWLPRKNSQRLLRLQLRGVTDAQSHTS